MGTGKAGSRINAGVFQDDKVRAAAGKSEDGLRG
jgi:hypothetical protein